MATAAVHPESVSKEPHKYGSLYYGMRVWPYVSFSAMGKMTKNAVCKSAYKYADLPEDLSGKVVVITGANTGIGKECVKAIAQRGGKVLMACRDQARAQAAIDELVEQVGADKRANMSFVKLDLSSLESVRKAAEDINRQTSHIDVLINNAGVMQTPEWKTKDGFEFQFGTNHLGHFLFTQLLMARLRSAPAGARVVNVSSDLHQPGAIHWDNINLTGEYGGLKAYAQSKLANIYFAQEMARRLGPGSSIHTYALHPGIIKTELARHQMDINKENFFRRNFLISPELGAQTSLYCAFDPAAGKETGQYYDNCARVDNLWPHVKDAAAARRLWELSLKLVKVDDRV